MRRWHLLAGQLVNHCCTIVSYVRAVKMRTLMRATVWEPVKNALDGIVGHFFTCACKCDHEAGDSVAVEYSEMPATKADCDSFGRFRDLKCLLNERATQHQFFYFRPLYSAIRNF